MEHLKRTTHAQEIDLEVLTVNRKEEQCEEVTTGSPVERRRKGTHGVAGQQRQGWLKGFSSSAPPAPPVSPTYAAEGWSREGSGDWLHQPRDLCQRGRTGPWTGKRGFCRDAGGRLRWLLYGGAAVGSRWVIDSGSARGERGEAVKME
jgi:hypothetical protein